MTGGKWSSVVAGLAVVAAFTSTARAADPVLIDLTHPIPTFHASESDPMMPDLAKPYGDSKPIPTFGQQAVLQVVQFPTSDGHFNLGSVVLHEHHGTHVDSPAHYVNNAESLEAGLPPAEERKHVDLLDASDLIGPVVLIDISGRVQAELDKNGGRPSPDPSTTDFSNDSPNVVGADDIAAVADKLDDGVWLVLNFGWSKFYFESPDFAESPYINGWNHPGLSRAGVDKLIEVMDERGIKINGIVADNIGIDSGENAIGDDDKWTNSWHAHVRLLQRGLLFVENATNLDQLAMTDPDSCTLMVGAPKHTMGTGGPSRVLAMCGD